MADEEPKEQDPESQCRTLRDLFFYKIDRTLAIAGIILLSGFALWIRTTETIAAGALGIGALATYIGNRGK